MCTIKEEEVDLSDYQNFADAQNQIGRFVEEVYMTKRIHSSLGYLTQPSLRPPGGRRPWPKYPPKQSQKSVQIYGSTTHSSPRCTPVLAIFAASM